MSWYRQAGTSPAFVLGALAFAALAACNESRPPPQPASFDRPTDVDFVCVRDNEVVELRRCEVNDQRRALHAVVTQSARGEVAAVNLETQRILDNRRDVPGYTFVPAGELPIAIVVPPEHPQFTYVANYGSRDVWVLRTDTVVSLSNEDALVQRVALADAGGDAGVLAAAPSDMILTPTEDGLLVALPDAGSVVHLPLVRCEAGASDCVDGLIDEARITTIALDEPVPALSAAVVPADEYSLTCDFDRPPLPEVPRPVVLPAAGPARPVALALDASCDGDRCPRRILIADDARPMLHVLDVRALREGEDALLAPIATGVPTRDVVVTPRVPTVVGGDDTTYYIYAIDATDGSVLALENDRLLAINHDGLGRVDRLPIPGLSGRAPALAVSLEVLTPAFDPENPSKQVRLGSSDIPSVVDANVCLDSEHPERSQRRLRGVFLAAALADNTLRLFDVHDMELGTCVKDGDACLPGVSAVQLERHHPRLATNLFAVDANDREPMRPLANAIAYIAEGTVYGIRNNGRTATPLAPALECITCDPELDQAFPDSEDQEYGQAVSDAGASDAATADASDLGIADAGTADAAVADSDEEDAVVGCPKDNSALLCLPRDPWVGAVETYSFVWEGILPSSLGGDGRFVEPSKAENRTGALEWLGSAPFCEAGVLGALDVPAVRDDALCRADVPAPSGDQLVITAEPVADSRLESTVTQTQRDTCAELRAALKAEDPKPVAFRVIAAFSDRLAIEPQLIERIGRVARYSDVQPCYGDAPLKFEVRVSDSFRVSTGRSGIPSRVVANNEGRCAVAPGSDPGRSGRAWRGCEYRDAALQLRFSEELGTNVSEPPIGLALQIQAGSTAPTLVLDTRQVALGVEAAVPVRVRYSGTNQELYLVDTHRGGLIPITLDPFPTAPPYSFY